jgi:hypothetical protein
MTTSLKRKRKWLPTDIRIYQIIMNPLKLKTMKEPMSSTANAKPNIENLFARFPKIKMRW